MPTSSVAVQARRRPTLARVGLRVALLTVLLTVLLGLPPTSPAGAAPGDPGDPGNPPDSATGADSDLEEKRDEARQIEAEVERLGREAAIVLEEYHLASGALEEADTRLRGVRSRVSGLRAAVEASEAMADARILDLYRGTNSPAVALSYLDVDDVQRLGTMHKYARTLAADDRARIDELSVRQRALLEEEAHLEEARAEVATQEQELRQRRNEVEAAMERRQATLARAEGEIATLIEEERQRRAAEEARRAREELARQQAAEEEARRAEERRAAEEEARRRAAESEVGTDVAPATTTTTRPADMGSGSRPTAPAPSPHPNAQVAVGEAKAQLGKPYQWAGNGPETFDCSGLTKWAWAAAGVSIPRSSQTQFAGLPKVAFDAIQPGDLLFYGSPIHHVGIYIGNGEMVNAPYTGTTVRIDSIYRRDFAGAARPG